MGRRLLLGVLVSVFLALLITYQIDFSQLLLSLRSARYPLIIAAAFVLASTQLLKSWRWRYLLEPVKSISVFHLLPPTVIGAMVDMVFPARAGEFVRAYLIGQKEQVSKISSLATIVVEKLFDIFILLFIAVLILIFMNLSVQASVLPEGFEVGVYTSVLLFLGVCGCAWLMMTRADQFVRITNSWFAFLPESWSAKMTAMIRSFALGLQAVKKGQSLLNILFLSFLLWSTYALSNFLILQSFNLELPVYASFFFLVFQILGVTLPSSPGFIGTYHAAVVIGFTIFHISQELALSVAIIMHAAFFFPFVLLGFVFLWTENLSFGEILSVETGDFER